MSRGSGIHQFRGMLSPHRAPEVPIYPGLLAAPTGKGDISNISGTLASRRDAPRMRSVEVTRRVARMLSFGVGGTKVAGARGGSTLSPVKLRNIPREILQPVRAGSSGTIPHLAWNGRATLRTTKIDDADFGGRILFRVFLSGA